jgi:hypothetical protein
VTRVLRGFLGPWDIDRLITAWRATSAGGWHVVRAQRQAYRFTPAAPPPDLMARALAELPSEPAWRYTDSFYLHYRNGDRAPPHVDPRSGVRLNACLIPPWAGRLVVAGEEVWLEAGDAVVFRPSEQVHEVTPVTGERLIWSVGRAVNRGR